MLIDEKKDRRHGNYFMFISLNDDNCLRAMFFLIFADGQIKIKIIFLPVKV